MTTHVNLENSWKSRLESEFSKPYMLTLKDYLTKQYSAGKTIYPKGSEYFSALNSTKFENVKIVILGQDPYHGPGQAHGLSFSVPEGIRPPPSLLNIFKELERDLGLKRPSNGHLQKWADQGVLLLNAVLTVEGSKPASHSVMGWETFTDAVIARLNEERTNLVFLLWGSYAQKKGSMIDRSKHRVLTAPHPSPLSAHRGFIGCGHFSDANDYLVSTGQQAIDWSL